MGMIFQGLRQPVMWCVRLILTFVVGAIGESGIRSLAARPIPVSIANDVKADVKANVRPDLLWSGKACFVSIDSEEPVSIDFDGRWTAIVPAGKHRVYHNHDSNNTTEYTTTRWWETPTAVIVRKP